MSYPNSSQKKREKKLQNCHGQNYHEPIGTNHAMMEFRKMFSSHQHHIKQKIKTPQEKIRKHKKKHSKVVRSVYRQQNKGKAKKGSQQSQSLHSRGWSVCCHLCHRCHYLQWRSSSLPTIRKRPRSQLLIMHIKKIPHNVNEICKTKTAPTYGYLPRWKRKKHHLTGKT